MNRIFKALRAVVCVAGLLLSQSLLAQTALVTDVSGKATMQGGKGDLVILSDLQRGNRVKVENGARLTVTYVKSGDEYVFTGPSEFIVEEGDDP